MNRDYGYKPRGAFARTQTNIHGKAKPSHSGNISARQLFGNSRTNRAPRRLPTGGRGQGGFYGSRRTLPLPNRTRSKPMPPGSLSRPNKPKPTPFSSGRYRGGGKLRKKPIKMKRGGTVSGQNFRKPMRGRRRK